MTVYPLNFPAYEQRSQTIIIKHESEKSLVFDPIRKEWVALLPEEWVRQHVITYLMLDKSYPPGLLAVEKGFQFQSKQYRADLIAHDRAGKPFLMVECKAPDVKIDQQVFNQVSRYNRVIRAPYLYVTNGLQHYCFTTDQVQKTYRFIESVPAFHEP